MMKIPTFIQAKEAIQNGNPTPLDHYVYNNETASFANANWRAELQLLIDYVFSLSAERSLCGSFEDSKCPNTDKTRMLAKASLPDTYENY